MLQNPGVKTLEWDPMSQRRINMGFGKVIQLKLGWLWTWLMVQDHFSFIWSWWYIILCCEEHSTRYRSMDMAGPVKELKDWVHVRPIKLSELNDGWLIADKQLTRFRKYGDWILGRVKISELKSVQGPKYSEKDLVLKEEDSKRTERLSVTESITNRNHVPVVEVWNNSFENL